MPTTKSVLRKTKLTNNKYPIYLRITHLRKSKFFRTPFNSSLKEWNSKTGQFNAKNDNAIQNNLVLKKFESRVLIIVNDFELEDKDICLKSIEKALRTVTNPINNNVFVFWSLIIREMLDSGRISSAKIDSETFSSLKKFNNNSVSLTFEELNPDFLYRYEVFLRKNNGTDGGIGVKMRTIRAIYNKAINRNITKKSNYPFETYKISKLKGKALKRALDIEDIHKIINCDLSENQNLKTAQNYFSFSFYTRGMNFVDIMLLEETNVSKDKIAYTRSKTGFNFNIKILPPVQDILDYYKSNKTTATKYVFPILLKDNLEPNQIENRKHKVLKDYNKNLKKLARLSGVTSNLTSYVARHSFANYMMVNGASTEVIRDSLGHQQLSTTKSYLKDLGSSVVDDACDLLFPN